MRSKRLFDCRCAIRRDDPPTVVAGLECLPCAYRPARAVAGMFQTNGPALDTILIAGYYPIKAGDDLTLTLQNGTALYFTVQDVKATDGSATRTLLTVTPDQQRANGQG